MLAFDQVVLQTKGCYVSVWWSMSGTSCMKTIAEIYAWFVMKILLKNYKKKIKKNIFLKEMKTL